MPAVVVPALIAAAGSVAAAKIQSNTANKAAQQEQAGAQKALDVQTGIYNQTRQDYAPYRQIGAQSLSQLANYANAPVVQRAAGPTGYQPGYQPGMTLGGMRAGSPPMPGMTPDGDLVTMQAPNGQTQQVKRDLVAHYQRLGAQVVGGGGGV